MHNNITVISDVHPIQAVLSLGGHTFPFNVERTTIPSNHVLFNPGPNRHVSPLSDLIGVPLVIFRHRTDATMDHVSSNIRASLDNASTTFLMMNPFTGWAPAEWQQGIGPVSAFSYSFSSTLLPRRRNQSPSEEKQTHVHVLFAALTPPIPHH